MIFSAAFVSPDLISEKVREKNNTPQTVATTAEIMPVITKVAGNNPSGIRQMV